MADNPNEIKSLILPITAEEYDKLSKSKFATPGLHLSEIVKPLEWKTIGKSVVFKFKIVEQGEDNGKEGELTAGIDAKSAWKFEECREALDMSINFVKTKDGATRPKFDPVEPLGHQFYSEWAPDEYTKDDGTVTKYVKCVKFWSIAKGGKMVGALPADEPGAVEEMQ